MIKDAVFLGEEGKGPYPAKLAGTTEHSHQVALFAWAALPPVAEAFPELERGLFAIPNGGSRGDTQQSRSIEGGKMKAEGAKAGVSDMMLAVPKGGCHGLFIELKKLKAKGVGPSDEQTKFGNFVQNQGYGFIVCYGWRDARDIIIQYLSQ